MARKIFTLLSEMSDSLAELQAMLAPFASAGPATGIGTAASGGKKARRIARAVVRATATAKVGTGSTKPGAAASRSARTVSPKLLLHTKYMNVLRHVTGQKRIQIKKVREMKGTEAAIRFAAALKK